MDQTLTENISEGVLKKEETEISDKEILANVLPVEKSKLKGESLQEVEDVINLSGVNALSAADSLNQIEDEIAYEVALHEVLDIYYAEDTIENEGKIAAFSQVADNRSKKILENYAEAKAERDNQENLDYEVGKVLVRFENGTREEEIAEIAKRMGTGYNILDGVPIDESLPEYKLQRLKKNSDQKFPISVSMNIGLDKTVERAEDILSNLSSVVSVEPNGLMDVASLQEELQVNDPKVEELYYLKDIKVPATWTRWNRSECNFLRTCVAVIDTGLDITHDDLKNMYLKDKSISMVGSDDNYVTQPMNLDNCYLKNVRGDRHGTSIAGIIAAQSNNSKGIVGITSMNNCDNGICDLMAINASIRVPYGDGFEARVGIDKTVEGILYAVNNGADVINLSFEDPNKYAALEDAINYAYSKNVVVCAAAGNGASNIPCYPAAYDHVISVAGWDSSINAPWESSNYHSTVDITAPACALVVCGINSTYKIVPGGTSYSSPMVAAAAAILAGMRDENGFYLNVDEIEEILCSKAKDVYTPGKDDYTGSGLLNISSAFEEARKRILNRNTLQNFVASAKNYQAITMRWRWIPWAEQYVVYRSTDPNGTYTAIKHLRWEDSEVSSPTWYFTDTTCDTGTTYYYKVRAAATYGDAFVYSKFSPVVSAKCTLAAPESLTLTAGTGKVTASWNKVAGATGYRVFRATSKTGTYTRIKNIANANTLSYADTSVKAGTTYYYKVRAYRTVNGKDILSDFSNIVGKTAK